MLQEMIAILLVAVVSMVRVRRVLCEDVEERRRNEEECIQELTYLLLFFRKGTGFPNCLSKGFIRSPDGGNWKYCAPSWQ